MTLGVMTARLWRAAHLCRNGHGEDSALGRWTAVNKKKTSSGAIIIRIANRD